MSQRNMSSGLAVALALVAGAATADTYNLGDLVSQHGTITIGDKTFGDFGFASASAQASSATVTPSIDNWGVYHLTFQGPWVAAYGAMVDIGLTYSVTATDPRVGIDTIDQSYVLSVGGTGGFILIGETVRTGGFSGPVTAQSSLSFIPAVPNPLTDLEDPVAEPITGDDLLVDPTQSKLWVTKDIFFGAEAAGIIGPTSIDQSFHQAPTPDGGTTLFLLGIGVSAFEFLRRRIAARV